MKGGGEFIGFQLWIEAASFAACVVGGPPLSYPRCCGIACEHRHWRQEYQKHHTAAKPPWAAIRHNADDKGGLMRTFLRAAVLGIVVAGVSGIQVIAQATDPVVGTWELNVVKSKFSPGPAPKSETRTYVVSGQEIKGTAKGVDSEGKAVAVEWTVVDDGKDRPVTGTPDIDMLSIKRIDSHTVESTHKRDGKVVATARRTVSKDGKTLTITTKGTNAKGQAINNVQVFEKR
ncbi:MAG TPA: hypothetical protein VHJ58_12230 [Vicinamibacterales bacterium]|nr:hypothetical protein [Vicinamibacterales bacterium]